MENDRKRRADLGLADARAGFDGIARRDRLTFGDREPMVALARVTASEYGCPAPGYAEARELLKA